MKDESHADIFVDAARRRYTRARRRAPALECTRDVLFIQRVTGRVQRSGARAPVGGKVAVRSSPMKRKKRAPNDEAFDTPIRTTGARATADPTNGVTDVNLASGLASVVEEIKQLRGLQALLPLLPKLEETIRDVAELKVQQRNGHSVKAGPEADEEMLRRMCHGIVDNVAHRLSQSTTASPRKSQNPLKWSKNGQGCPGPWSMG